MSIKNNKIIIIASIIIFIISKLLGGTILVSLFLSLSIVILYFLGKKEHKIYSNIIGGLILIIDAILIILLLIPTKSYNMDIKKFYASRQNYIKIYIRDSEEKLKSMAIIIWGENNKKREIIKLSEYKKNNKILVFPKDKIYFLGRKNNKSYAAIYLWDGSILRITPGTILKLEKLTKNLEKLSNNQTQIKLENGNIWFHINKLIKDSSNMQIKTSTGQMLIIRGTAGLVSKLTDDKTFAINYSHFIEVKNSKESIILKEGEGAVITDNNIIIKNIKDILKNIGLSKDILSYFNQVDKQDLSEFQKNIVEFLKKNLGNNLINKIEWLKLKVFSIGSKNYKEYLENLETYKYLIGETNKLTDKIINNPNLAFIASNLGKQQAKIAYLYNKLKNDISNSDLYKTYIINLGIEGKIKNLTNESIKKIIEGKEFLENLFKQGK